MKGTNIVILMFLLLVLSPPLISKAEEIKSLNSLSVRLDSLRKSLVMYTHLKDEILKMAENNDKLNENDIEELIKLSKILSEYTSMELNTDPNDVSYQQKLNALADKFYEKYKNRSSKLPTESLRQQLLPELRQQPLPEFSDSARDDALEPEMVMIPAGSFLMGSPLNEPGRFDHER